MRIEQTDTWQNGRVKSADSTFESYFDTESRDFTLSMYGDCCIETDYYHYGGYGFALNVEQATKLKRELEEFLREVNDEA